METQWTGMFFIYIACEQAPGEDGKNFGERETEEFGEQSDRGGDRGLACALGLSLKIFAFFFFGFLWSFNFIYAPWKGFCINLAQSEHFLHKRVRAKV